MGISIHLYVFVVELNIKGVAVAEAAIAYRPAVFVIRMKQHQPACWVRNKIINFKGGFASSGVLTRRRKFSSEIVAIISNCLIYRLAAHLTCSCWGVG